jgi:hypothetical protein
MTKRGTRRRALPVDLALSALLFTTSTTADLFPTAISPAVQDGFINATPTTCPVAQDGYTYNTFPWTHNPICMDAKLPNTDGDKSSVLQKFCVYTNINYNNGRGVSFVVSPEVAASITFETYGMAVGGLEGQIGEEMGMWEVKDTKERGRGLFVKKDIAAAFAGESLIIKSPVLFVSKQVLELPPTTQGDSVLKLAIDQLPERTREAAKSMAKSWGGTEASDLTKTNGIEVKWPWVDEVPLLLAVTPEVAVGLTITKKN